LIRFVNIYYTINFVETTFSELAANLHKLVNSNYNCSCIYKQTYSYIAFVFVIMLPTFV